MAGLVVKPDQLAGAKGKGCICASRVIAEVNLVHTRPKVLDDSADVPSSKPLLRHLFDESHHR